MDAARSAIRSGASSVTIVYRRGREDMPAQREEIEEAVREGVTLLTALAPFEVVARDGVVVALRCAGAAGRPGPTDRGRRVYAAVPGAVREVPGQHDPRRDRRGAGPVDPPRGGRDRGQRLGRDRGRSAHAGDGPRRHLRRRRRRLRPEDDHRRGRGRTPCRRVDPRAPRRRPRRRSARFSRRCATRPRPSGTSRSISPPGRARTRRCRWWSSGRSRPTRSASMPSDAPAPRRARCFRCDAVYGCQSVSVTAGRGPHEASVDRHRIEQLAVRPPEPTGTTSTTGGVQ